MHCFHLVTPPDRLQICLDVIFLLKQVMFIVKLDGPVIFLSRCIKTLQPAKAKSITPVGIPSFWGFTSFTWGLPQNEVNNKNKLLMNLNSIYKLLSISVSFFCLNSYTLKLRYDYLEWSSAERPPPLIACQTNHMAATVWLAKTNSILHCHRIESDRQWKRVCHRRTLRERQFMIGVPVKVNTLGFQVVSTCSPLFMLSHSFQGHRKGLPDAQWTKRKDWLGYDGSSWGWRSDSEPRQTGVLFELVIETGKPDILFYAILSKLRKHEQNMCL